MKPSALATASADELHADAILNFRTMAARAVADFEIKEFESAEAKLRGCIRIVECVRSRK